MVSPFFVRYAGIGSPESLLTASVTISGIILEYCEEGLEIVVFVKRFLCFYIWRIIEPGDE